MLGVNALLVLVTGLAQATEFRPVPPPVLPGTAAVHGRVLDAITDAPVSGLDVRLIESDAAGALRRGPRDLPRTATTRTDSRGAFSFTKVGAGTYGIMVSGKTHLPSCFGSTRQAFGPCVFISLDGNQVQRDADIFARPGAIVRGRVVDHDGQPINRAGVRLEAPERNLAFAGMTNSDVEGHFEIGGVTPGRFFLVVEHPGRAGEGMIRAFHPGVSQQRDAELIAVEIGDAIEVEIRMPRLILGRINTHVSGPSGFQLESLVLWQPSTSLRISLSTVDDGANEVGNLREGRYLIEARGSAGGKPLSAFAVIEVAEGETEAALQLEESGTIIGRVVAERGGVPPIAGLRIAASWVVDGATVDPAGAAESAMSADGGFSFDRLFGTRIFGVAGLDPAWRVVSIRAGRTEIMDTAFDVAPRSRTELIVTVARQ
jgi:protocatechuate 3,4-dioxygenase beta subunit